MAAILRIDQAGLPLGVDDRSRSDGLDTGIDVTLTSVGTGTLHVLVLDWVPEEDTTAVATLVPTSTTTWKFTPTPGVYGSYRIRLTVDGVVTRRVFSIRLPNSGLRIPALNEKADPLASLFLSGPTEIETSEYNENLPGGPFAGGNYGGYYVDLRELFKKIEDLFSGAGLPALPGDQYSVLMEDPIGDRVFQRLTEDMILPGFSIVSFSKVSPNGGQVLYRRGDTLTGVAISASYSSLPDGASIANVLGGSVDGGDIAPGAWTILTPFTSGAMAGSIKRSGTDGGSDPTWQIQLTTNLGSFIKNSTIGVQWTRDVYYGVGPAGLNTEGPIEALAGSELATGRARTFTVSPSNEKVYYAFPQSYGTAVFTLNGFPAAFNAPFGLVMTNVNGVTSTYDVYESVNLLTGTGLNFVVT